MNRLLGDYIRRNIDGVQTLKPVATSYYAGVTQVTQEPAYSRVNQSNTNPPIADADAAQGHPSSHAQPTESDYKQYLSDSVTNAAVNHTSSESSLNRHSDEFSNRRRDIARHDLYSESDSASEVLRSDSDKSDSVGGERAISQDRLHLSTEGTNEAYSDRAYRQRGFSQSADSDSEIVHRGHDETLEQQEHFDSRLREATELADNTTSASAGRSRQDFTQQVAASILGQSQPKSKSKSKPQPKFKPQTPPQALSPNSLNADPELRRGGIEPLGTNNPHRRRNARSEQPVLVNVTIDSVTIVSKHVPAQAAHAERSVKRTWKPDLSLADYLRQRQEGER
ncbi:hypothetical protein [Enterovibrio calviensis]|uniref:hypothetical protein n=1 Tax=Enterovibrio calviensis TaxID=91359 RepID=UPI00048382E0|nr:hypothetical protein [Enterovibrio calviensis]